MWKSWASSGSFDRKHLLINEFADFHYVCWWYVFLCTTLHVCQSFSVFISFRIFVVSCQHSVILCRRIGFLFSYMYYLFALTMNFFFFFVVRFHSFLIENDSLSHLFSFAFCVDVIRWMKSKWIISVKSWFLIKTLWCLF